MSKMTKGEFLQIWRSMPIRVTAHLIWRIPLITCWAVEGLIIGIKQGLHRSGRRSP